jgi:hypothetical protein
MAAERTEWLFSQTGVLDDDKLTGKPLGHDR